MKEAHQTIELAGRGGNGEGKATVNVSYRQIGSNAMLMRFGCWLRVRCAQTQQQSAERRTPQ